MHQSNLQGKPPPEVYRPFTKCKIRTQRLTLLTLVFSSLVSQANACDYGYYILSSACVVCPAGKYCPDGSNKYNCGSSTWSPQGAKDCSNCPAGFSCSSTSAFPQGCDVQSNEYSTGSATSCTSIGAGYYTSKPSTAPSTCAAPVYAYQSCNGCAAGKACSSGSETSCVAAGYRHFFGNTYTSCTTTSSGYFSKDGYFDQVACPAFTYSTSAGASSCTYVSSGYKVNANQKGQTACTGTTTQSGYGAAACSYAPAGYYIGSGQTAGTITMRPIPQGYYKASVTTQDAVQCEYGYSCTTTAKTACDAMKYSILGWSDCFRVPIGYYASGSALTACTNTDYDTVTSTCQTCSYGKCDQFTALNQGCQVGYYFASSSTTTCTICPIGKFCDDGIIAQTATKYYPAINTQEIFGEVACPAGYECTYTTMTELVAGEYSLIADGDGTEKDYLVQKDLSTTNAGGDCPAQSYRNSVRLSCTPTGFQNKPLNDGSGDPTSEEDCGAAMIAWIMDPCVTLSQNDNYHFESDETKVYSGVHCPTGWEAYYDVDGTEDYICTFRAAASNVAVDYVKGRAVQCPTGDFVISSYTAFNTVSYFHGMLDANEAVQCQDCPINSRCQSSLENANTGWCVGKDPTIDWYDVNNGDLLIQMDDRRVSIYQNQHCFDCNAEEFSDGICTFGSDYFPDHERTSSSSNSFVEDMILVCPFQSATRSQQRYLDTVQWDRLDQDRWTSFDMQATTYTYDTYAFFDDTENNIYPYSYCNIDETYFTAAQITSHSEFADSTESVETECTLYEHFSPNFPMCVPTFQGFIAGTVHNDPTEYAVQDGYITQLTQNDAYTGIKLMECPEFTEYLMIEGSAGIYHGCHIKEIGSCVDSTSDYCNNGQDYMCPSGFTKKTSGPYTNTINDCLSCAAGEVCSDSETSTVCPDGYNCEAMTDDVYSKPGQPGELLVPNAGTLNNDITDCTGGYCEGATYLATVITCPTAYNLDQYAGSSTTGQHSKAGCYPNDAGTYSDSVTTCDAGYICPPGSQLADYEIPPGWYSASTGITAFTDSELTLCPAGSFCASGSTTTGVSCDAGYYCEEGTTFRFDTPCDFSSTTAAGSGAYSDCVPCTDGDFCRQGQASLADGSYCGMDNFLCLGGDLKRTECADGEETTDGAVCSACSAGQFCQAGVPAIDCEPGYESAGSLSTCALSSPGQVTTGGSATADVTDGSWTIDGQTTEFTCPAGYFCTAGVITGCQVGETCPEGSTAALTAAAGTVGDEVNLFYDKPCPAGYTCGALATRAEVTAGQYTVQSDSGAAASYCNSGYSCDVGSIGPYQTVCAEGTYYLTGVASATCPACADGSYCYQAMEIACEPGMYCDISTMPEFHQQCPLGTYSLAGSNAVECTECDGGFACIQRGLTTTPTYACGQGYFCVTGSTSTQPERIVGVTASPDDTYQCDPTLYDTGLVGDLASLAMSNGLVCNQGVCPRGYYCPWGTIWPVICPVGTYNLNYGEVSLLGCVSCIDGYYCPTTLGRISCDQGTVCPTGQDNQDSVTNPVILKPNVGYYSLEKYPDQIPCAAGEFQAGTGSFECDSCTAGSQCPITAMSVVDTCDLGADCSLAGTIVPQLCQYGQYLDPSNTVNPGCVDCPEDNFCWEDGIIEADVISDSIMRSGYKTSGLCPSGYKCISGADIRGQNQDFATSPTAYLCRVGYYCDNTNTGDVEKTCAAGSYMPRIGAMVDTDCLACKPGYECSAAGTSVPSDCPSGFFCVESTTTTIDQCSAGTYCPTNAEEEFACAYGSYTAATGETSCTTAQAGTYIDTTSAIIEIDCPIGYHCEAGSVKPAPCPAGTTSVLNTFAQADCTDVAIGEYRSNPTINGVVADGYSAPSAGEYYEIPTRYGAVCETGSYCVGGVQTACAAGTRCEFEMAVDNVVVGQDECDAGYYCIGGTNRRRPTSLTNHFGDICTEAHYCLESTSTPTECPIGYYSDALGLQAEDQCQFCKNGYYCPTLALLYADMTICPQGYFCEAQTKTSSGTGICDFGKYCPEGSLEELPCAAGTYQDAQGEYECIICPIGSYCSFEYTIDTSVITSQKFICPIGYMCPDTSMSAPTPCSAGFYQTATGQTVCIACVAGYYCPLQATEDYTTYPCPNQFYCAVGASKPVLCLDGQHCETTTPSSQTVYTNCPAGYYCIAGIQYVCYSGYMCLDGATSPFPTDGSTGSLCDQGYYCLEGATTATPCGAGNYQAFFGATSVSNCIVCPAGTSCPLAANVVYTTVTCTAGYICEQNVEIPCDAGMYCPQSTLVMLKCPAQQYQDLTAQTTCKTCPELYYCPSDVSVGTIVPLDCPDGHYCPEGTGNFDIYRCGTGTYHLTTDGPLAASTDCTDCEETYYCPQVAMTEADYLSFPCQDGYLCGAGSESGTGTADCPKDQYCIAGVATYCPAGYYSTETGLRSASECIACPPGKICPSYSAGIYSCLEGYFCPGLITLEADMTICPVGHYCPSGAALALMCEPSTYQDTTGQSECQTCTEGNYCPTSGLSDPIPCVTDYEMFYCPEGSIYPQKCAIGYYIEADQFTCTECPAGYYCWPAPDNSNDGQEAECDYAEGYLCREGAFSPRPLIDGLAFIQPGSNYFLSYNGPVAAGYTAQADGIAEACIAGFFQPSIMSSECLDCYQGHYCPNDGMSDLAEYKCAAGYYCLVGSWLEEPLLTDLYLGTNPDYTGGSIGGICEVTFECSYALIHKMLCEDGHISQEEGLSQCGTCPSGYYCDIEEDSADPILCISQSVCTSAEKRQPICPAGTFMNEGDQYCQKCTAGHYCVAGIIAEECAAGYLCAEPDFNKTPDPAGTECEVGWYCPKGDTSATRCPFETMSVTAVAKQVTDCRSCQPGYLCPWGSRTATECPEGYYCPPQADDIIYKGEQYACELGTYNPWTKKVYQVDCLDCDDGYYCNTTAIANISSRECPKGHYCPLRTIQPRPCPAGTYQSSLGAFDEDTCDGCPLGKYCPEASEIDLPCEEGFFCPFRSATMLTCTGGWYCNDETRFQETECPVNSYCPRGTAFPKPCDDKHICPARTEQQIFCQNGYYVDTGPSSYGGQNLCKMCRIGTYSIADTVGCAPCPPGYLCYGGTNTNTPISITYNRGEVCPKGAYCPEGSYQEELCPPGTYNQDVGAGSLEECALCPAGSANNFYGAEGCSPCGQFASSNEGARQCTCSGKNRVYSPVDNSCRCRSGFDFKNIDSVSEGQSSDVTDCIPLVFDRCDAEGEVRDPSGRCTQKNSCAAECKGGSGSRDDILGVCSCVGQKTTDEICNQECRSKAPKMAFSSSTSVILTIDGVPQNVDLTQAADVYGKASGTGDIKPVTLSSTGYVGSYGTPKLLNEAANLTAQAEALAEEAALNATRRRQRVVNAAASSTRNRKLEASYLGDRNLQAISTVTDEIPNPVYCISEQDTFLFQIPEPTHYPVYMKDSVMNNNLGFDYGSFIDLAVEMKRKQAQNLATASMFAFTFTESGNYVFQDGDDQSQILVITVKGLGEKCADPDRYLQIQSGDSLAQNGIGQRTDIIIQPNYPLIISMTFLLFFGTGFTMWMVSYCMKKGWYIKDIPRDNYRETQLSINIHHENEKVFIDNNDFVQHKSELIDHQEDELDTCNLDIQQDLVDAGKKYLHKYEKRKQKHKRAKLQKKKQIEELMAEVESLVHILNSDSTAAQMHWLDLEVLQEGAQIDDKTIKFQIEKQMEAINRQEDKQNENYKAKKEELLTMASDRERQLYEQAREKMLLVQADMMKHFNQGDEILDTKSASEFAIYDNGDIRSKNNQLVKKIEQNENLNDEEKEHLLQTHEKNLHNIDNLLEVEKRKQEQELDRALKERLDRRHRLKEKQHGAQISKEQASVEKDAVEEFDHKRKEALDGLSKQHEQQVKEILTNSDLVLQRQQINDLEELTDQKKRQAASDLENDQNKEIEARKAQISKNFMNGAENEEELAHELQKLMGDQASATQNLMNQAASEKSSQEAKLKERLAKRQQKIQEQMKEETDKVIAQVEKEDVIHLHERETVATEAHLRLKAKALLQDGNDGTLPTGCLGLDRQGLPITDAKKVQASDVARKEAEERKEAVKENMFKLDQEIDTSLQQKSLLAELESQDASLALMLKQQDDKQAAKLDARRAQLKARRLGKVKNEQQEKTVRAEIDVEEEKQEEQQKITEKYVRSLFKQVPKNETPQQRDKRLEILNEYLSDQFLEELSGMLTKQYIESDALLKMTMRKYLEEGICEATAIKEHFKIDNESLQLLKPHMKDEMYNDQLKKLKLNEENLLKRTDLTIQKAHADEEARIRKELDKKHMQEQIELRVNVSQRQAQMRMELVGESLMGDAEFEHDRKALERFQLLKSTEQDRRIRAIELQKKTLTNQVESEMKLSYENFDEMMRKKKQAQLEQADQQDSLRSRIQERMNRLKKNAVQQGMTQEEQDAMLKNYQEQLSQLDSAYASEQRRQQLIMKTKQENRKKRLIKVQQLKQELDKQSEAPQTTSKLTNSFAQALRRQMFKTQERIDDDSELLQRLKEWDTHKRDYEFTTFAKKAQEAGTVDLDENQIKIMILKLQQIEKLLKEVGKKKKLRNNLSPQPNKGPRRSSAASTLQQFQSSFKNGKQAQNLQGVVQESDMNSDDSEGATLIKRQDSKNLTARKSNPNNSRLGGRRF